MPPVLDPLIQWETFAENLPCSHLTFRAQNLTHVNAHLCANTHTI